MLCECDLLSRYNLWTNKWRSEQETGKEEKPTTDGKAMTTMITGLKRYATDQAHKQHLSHSNITTEVRGEGVRRTFLAEICDTSRAVWVIGSGANTVTAASEITGLNIQIVLKAGEDNEWRETDATKEPHQVSEATKDDEGTETDWVVILRAHKATKNKQQYMGIIRAGIRQRAKGIIMLWASEKSTTAEVKEWKKTLEENLYDGSSDGWECKTGRLHNERL
jgi:hypothetical protein